MDRSLAGLGFRPLPDRHGGPTQPMLLATCAAREPQMEQAAAAATRGVHAPAASVTSETATIRAC
eukprot:1755560-Alexandrium_andersonii.AAC.1